MTDFRDKTCGDCAWLYMWSEDKSECANTACKFKKIRPWVDACPAFVPRDNSNEGEI